MDLFYGLAGIWAVCAWFTHVVFCLKASLWGFLIAGALLPPIGIIHGTGIWLGIW